MKDLISYSARLTQAKLNAAFGKVSEIETWLQRVAEHDQKGVVLPDVLRAKAEELTKACNELSEVNNFLYALQSIKGG